MHRIFLFVLFSAALSLAAENYTIVHRNASDAARELGLFLGKSTGNGFKIVKEESFDGSVPAFYVGQTDFAKKNGVDFSAFQPDGWLYRSIGKNVILTGHPHDGTEYAVREFLENELGIRWYTFESTFIPEKKNPDFSNLNRSGRPAFVLRGIYMPPWDQKIKDIPSIGVFERRNKLNGYSSIHAPYSIRPGCHSFYSYVDPAKYFKDHPEYFSMNREGERFHGVNGGGGQLCMTNPKVAEIAAETLESFIESDRKALPKEKWPTVYDISQLDSTDYLCLCPECRKLSEAEGSDSALVLTFINRIAEKIAKKYPEIVIRTMAYVSGEKAPKTMRPAGNVLIQVCELYTRSDCYRPLTHEINAARRAIFDGWMKKNARMCVWDYWNMNIPGPYFDPPRVETIVDAIPGDIRYLHGIGVEDFFAEAETNLFENTQNFYDLHFWLGSKLLDKPDLDENLLIADFLKNHYGPAEKPMTEFLNDLRSAVASVKEPMFYIMNPARPYQTPEFMKKIYTLLKQAQSMTEPGSPYRLRVEKEMVTPLAVILGGNIDIGVDRKVLAEEYRACRLGQIEAYASFADKPELKKKLEQDVEKLTLVLEIPEKFKGIPPANIRQFAYPVFSHVSDDPGSDVGKALVSPVKDEKNMSHIMKPQAGQLYPTSFGLYDSDTKEGTAFHITEIPTDEKYHWYRIGSFNFGKNTSLWGWFWYRNVNLRSVWTNADGLAGFNTWTVWISVKIEGPAYVKDSKRGNAVSLDRVVLVKENKEK